MVILQLVVYKTLDEESHTKINPMQQRIQTSELYTYYNIVLLQSITRCIQINKGYKHKLQ